MSSDKVQFLLRDAEDSDYNFITSSWLKSYRSSAFAEGCPNDLYYAHLGAMIAHWRKTASLKVLCDPTDGNNLFGFICYDTDPMYGEGLGLLHFVYVKYTFRGFGLASKVLENVMQDNNIHTWFTSHNTTQLRGLSAKFPMHYSPFLIALGLMK